MPGLLQPVESAVLEERIPASLRDADNQWFGFSQRARIIFYNKERVPTPPQTYLALADPAYEGMVCIRSSTNTYNQTLLAAMITHHGTEVATDWARGVVANMAREPQGGDTDQLRGLASGECDIAVANTYYFARALRDDVEGVSDHLDIIGWLFPSQEAEGAHMNLSGGGVAAHAPNREAAVKFLEYLASDQAQIYFSAGNDEYPAVPGVPLAELGGQAGRVQGRRGQPLRGRQEHPRGAEDLQRGRLELIRTGRGRPARQTFSRLFSAPHPRRAFFDHARAGGTADPRGRDDAGITNS